MSERSGIDLLKTINRPPATILTTAYRQYAPESYDLDVVDYIFKPVTFDRFFKAIEKYLRISNHTAPDILSSSEPQFIYLKSGHKYFIVDTRDILYAQSVKDYVNVYTKDKTITSKYKISELEKKLTGKGFLRIHRSFIVNLKRVTAFTASDVEIGQIELPIGEAYKALVQQLKK